MIGPLLQTTLSLILVLGIIVGGAYVVKRLQRNIPGNLSLIHIKSLVSVGTREKIALVEVSGSWVLLGITPQQVTHLLTLPEAPILPETSLSAASAPSTESWFKKYLEEHLKK